MQADRVAFKRLNFGVKNSLCLKRKWQALVSLIILGIQLQWDIFDLKADWLSQDDTDTFE